MPKIAFFDMKPYDIRSFEGYRTDEMELLFFEHKLGSVTAGATAGYDAVVPFVNDTLDEATIQTLSRNGVRLIALRSAGYNNVDFKAAYGRINVVRVPWYSPYAVAEHAMALLLSLNRKTHRAFNRTREYNFSLNGLMGFDLHGKTVGVVGTGKIGQVFIDICKGFGMQVLAYDPYPNPNVEAKYVPLEELLAGSDVISLHCPLTESTHHMIDGAAFARMKKGVVVLNTSRGALIESEALLAALRAEQVGAAGLDVYEEEGDLFFEDFSDQVIRDEVLSTLVSLPNVLITSHQAFLTREALANIAATTMENIRAFFAGEPLVNEVCYRCLTKDGPTPDCTKAKNGRCF